MTVSKEPPTKDLRYQLRDSLREKFAQRLSRCKSVSPGQCKRVSELVTQDSVSAFAILAALGRGKEDDVARD